MSHPARSDRKKPTTWYSFEMVDTVTVAYGMSYLAQLTGSRSTRERGKGRKHSVETTDATSRT
jgi:hypothetical protein